MTPELELAMVKMIKERNYNNKAKSASLLDYEYRISQSRMLKIFKYDKFKSYKTIKKLDLIE